MVGDGEVHDGWEELRELSEALRAQLEWLAATGATALPRVAVAASAPVLNLPGDNPDAAEPRPTAAPLPASSPGARVVVADLPMVRTLDVVRAEVAGCTRCGLHEGRTQTVFARGNGASGLCFVGEGPGADEDAQGEPFVGAAGQLLDRMISAMKIARDEVYICNIVKCRPPNNRKPEPEEVAACVPYLREQIALLKPRVIVALGATAVEGLFGPGEGITRLRGKWKVYRGIPVMPTFHPAYLLRVGAAKRDVWSDLQLVMQQLGSS